MDDRHKPIVYGYAGGAAVLGVPGVFVPDVGALATMWAAMLSRIAEESDHEIDMSFALKVATGVATGAGAMAAGVKAFAWVGKWFPGIGTGTAIAINSSLNYVATYRLGKAFAEMVDRPGFDLHDAGTLIWTLIGIITGKFPAPESLPLSAS